MKSLKSHTLFINILIFLWLPVLFIQVNAQGGLTYNGPYQLGNGQQGRATYQFVVSRRDTIKQGSFRFNDVGVDSSKAISYYSMLYDGNYDGGLKNGSWLYSSRLIKPSTDYRESDYRIIHQTSGTEFLVKGNFNKGKANGNWTFIEQKITNSTPTDTITHIKTSYKNGLMSGRILGQHHGISFTGNINSDGYIDGVWIFKHKLLSLDDLEEHREYRNGVQTDHYIKINGDTLTLQYIGIDLDADEDEEWESINLNDKYFDVIKTANVGLDSSKLKIQHRSYIKETSNHLVNQTNGLLKQVLVSFTRRDNADFWLLLDGSDPLNQITARLRKYPISPVEKQNLSDASRILSEADAILHYIFNESNIELDKHANQELMFLFEVLKVYEFSAKKIAQLIGQFANPSFEYINRVELTNYLLNDLKYPDRITFEFNNQVIAEAYDFSKADSSETQNTNQLLAELDFILNDIKKIETRIDVLLESRLREYRLIEKEKLLIKRKDSVVALYSNKTNDEKFNPYHQQVATAINSYSLDVLKNYATLDAQLKIDTVDTILNCMDSFIKLYAAQAEIPTKLNRLDESYTRTVWNPYTMTDMQERMKERVYNAYLTYLFPFYLNDIENTTDCASIENKHRNFELIYRKMMELREQDTKDIERALRGANSARKILEIFDLNLYIN